MCGKEREKRFDGHKLASIPSHYRKRPVGGAYVAEAGVPMQLIVSCKDTTLINAQGDPFVCFICQKVKPLVQVGFLLSVMACRHHGEWVRGPVSSSDYCFPSVTADEG